MTFPVDVNVRVQPSTPLSAHLLVGADVHRPTVMLRIGESVGSGSSVVVFFDSPDRLVELADSMISAHRKWTAMAASTSSATTAPSPEEPEECAGRPASC